MHNSSTNISVMCLSYVDGRCTPVYWSSQEDLQLNACGCEAEHYADELQMDLEDIMSDDFNVELEDDSPSLVRPADHLCSSAWPLAMQRYATNYHISFNLSTSYGYP